MFERSSRLGVVAATAALAITVATVSPVQAQTSSAEAKTFACDPGFYQVISGQLAELDPGNNSYSTLGTKESSYNAMGYSIADGFMYGIRNSDLVRIDANGVVTVVHELDMPSGSYTGDFGDDGLLHVSRGGRDWHAVDVETGAATSMSALSGGYGVADIANVHGVFYGLSSVGDLYRINPTTQIVEDLGRVAGLPSGSQSFGAAWSSAGGNLYVGRNSGEIFQITGYSTDSPQATQVATAPSTNSNDGASCSLAGAPIGLADVDGPEPETPPSTPEAQQAAEKYIEEGPTTYTFPSSGIADGPSCTNGADEDRPVRLGVNAAEVSSPTVVYSSGDGPVLADFDVLSGLWTQGNGTLDQTHDCGYDYTALLRAEPLQHYRWEATIGGPNGVNQGGLIVNQSSPLTRSGAGIIDFADGGNVVRWGTYDDAGYYQSVGSAPIDRTTANIHLVVEVHNSEVIVTIDGAVIGEFNSGGADGHVGLVTSRAAASFDDLTLTALVNPEARS